jgi:orotate phosphoribosyltransferase
MEQEIASKVAQYLLEAKAVKLNPEHPFTWASGWRSPIYCDNRVTLSYPEIRSYIKTSLASRIREVFPEVEIIVGVATAGIAIGALAADALNLPFAYARPKPKEHGMKNQLEGRVEAHHKIVVVYLREAGFEVLGMAAIFTYGFETADTNFKNANCKYFALSNYSALVESAIETNYISASQSQNLDDWRKSPSTWMQG